MAKTKTFAEKMMKNLKPVSTTTHYKIIKMTGCKVRSKYVQIDNEKDKSYYSIDPDRYSELL